MASNDPQFEAKAAEVIGLYLNPPAHAAVFCVDEKTAIQALDRLDPVLPLSPGRLERHGFEFTSVADLKRKLMRMRYIRQYNRAPKPEVGPPQSGSPHHYGFARYSPLARISQSQGIGKQRVTSRDSHVLAAVHRVSHRARDDHAAHRRSP